MFSSTFFEDKVRAGDLADFMIEHNTGVGEEHAYRIEKIDSDYFDEA